MLALCVLISACLIISTNCDSPSTPHLSLGTVQLHQFALITFESLTHPSPNEFDGKSNWANFQWKNGRYDAGIDIFDDLRHAFPHQYQAHFWFGTFSVQRGWPFWAYQGLTRALELGPRNLEVWNNLGVAMEKISEEGGSRVPPKAFADYELPGGWETWSPELRILRLEEALNLYDAACEMAVTEKVEPSRTSIACVNAARVAETLGKFKEALAYLENAILLSEATSCNYLFSQGQKNWINGKSEQARGYFIDGLAVPECVIPVPLGALTKEDDEAIRAKRFSKIYDTAFWGYQKSGPGSSLKETVVFRKQISDILRSYNVSSIIDVGCGDWTWMPHVNLSGINYFGVDIVPQLIDDNTKQAAEYMKTNSSTLPASIRFAHLDAVANPFSSDLSVDLILCREVLIHLPLADISKFLGHCNATNAKLLITDMDHRVTENSDQSATQFSLPGAGWRPINLLLPPFNLPPPLIDNLDRGARLWKLPLP